MKIADYAVRPIKPDDDFKLIDDVYYRTHFEGKSLKRHKNIYRKMNWKQLLFPESNVGEPAVLKGLSFSGFVALNNGVISAFATVGISPQSLNGYFDYGFIPDGEYMLEDLVNCCTDVVKKSGGGRLYQTASMPIGQIRNDQITLLESQGFRSNQFYHVFVDHRQIGSWNPSEDLDLSLIKVPSRIEINNISSILEEDREFFLAEEFRGNFSQDATPDHVFLCLYDDKEQIKGIAYYKVWEKNESLLATAFGVHFRPTYEVEREEIRHLIQATLVSMKQIGVTAAWSRVSSQCFNTILELSSAGFEIAPNHNVMMVKMV